MSATSKSLVRPSPARWSVALLLLSSCLGGQTGTEQNNGDDVLTPGEGGAPCDDVKERVELDDAELGFSANEVLAFVVGEHTTELAWRPATADASFGPESGTGGLTLEISASGAVYRVHSVPRSSGTSGGSVSTIGCPGPRLEVDVTLRLMSAGGALDEHLPAVLSATEAHFARLRASVALEDLGGSFAVSAAPGVTTKALEVQAIFSAEGHAGALTGSVEASMGASSRQGTIEYARWPADNPCQNPGYGPVIAQEPSPALARALQQLEAFSSAPFTWKSGSATSVELQVAASELACALPPSGGLPASLELPVTVQVRTGDGLIATSLSGALAMSGNTQRAELRAARSCEGATSADQAAACGLGDLDLGGRTHVSVSLQASISDPGGVSGSLDLLGVPPTSCKDTPSSACGSPPAGSFLGGRF